MVGIYPDVPAPRLPWDVDGTQLFAMSGNFASVSSGDYSQANKSLLNSETFAALDYAENGIYAVDKFYGLLFPSLRDLKGIVLIKESTGNTLAVQWSPDTTNLVDGTWNNVAVTQVDKSPLSYRNEIRPLSLTNVKGLRWHISDSSIRFNNLHLYGSPSAVGDRLEMWHPTLDESLNLHPAWLDWGDRPQGTTATKQIRVKNLSGTLTASPVTVSVEALTDTTPAYVGMYTLALGAGSPSATISIPSLAPGEVSDVITITQTLSNTAILSLWNQRIKAIAGGWS